MKYQITIPTPCNENWSKMTPTEKGAFCENCNKEVFDFTNKSNYQLAMLLDKNQNLCGKFKPEQLNIDISSVKNSGIQKAGFLFGLTTFLTFVSPVFGQNKSLETQKIEELIKKNQDSKITEKTSDSIQIKGKVENDIPLPGANVILKNTPYGTQADFDGNFSLTLSNDILDKHSILTFSYIGFESRDIKIDQTTRVLNIELLPNEDMLGIIVIKKQNIFRRIGSLFRKKNKEICDN